MFHAPRNRNPGRLRNLAATGLFCIGALGAFPSLLRAETLKQDFNSMADLNAFWEISTWGDNTRVHSSDNVSIADGILALKLSASPPGTKPVCAEIVSKRNNFRYGSYRASIKTSKTPGGVVGWFVYRDSPLNEVDVELLTRENRNLYFTLHHVQENVDSKVVKLAFDPTEAFHEYRFDWHPDRVEYFIDGNPAGTLTHQVPDLDAAIMLNHWSGNIEGWGGAAPTQDMFMYVDWMAYSSDFSVTTTLQAIAPSKSRPNDSYPFRARAWPLTAKFPPPSDGQPTWFGITGRRIEKPQSPFIP